jgi:hypothetical protein
MQLLWLICHWHFFFVVGISRKIRLVDTKPQFSDRDHCKKLSEKVVFELSMCKERVENKLAVHIFTLYC